MQAQDISSASKPSASLCSCTCSVHLLVYVHWFNTPCSLYTDLVYPVVTTPAQCSTTMYTGAVQVPARGDPGGVQQPGHEVPHGPAGRQVPLHH